MDLSILTARILALTYLAAGIAALRGKINFKKMVDEFERSPALTFTTGFIALIFGMILVTYHNRWVSNWTVLITIVGWLSLWKGIMFMAFPHNIATFKDWYANTQRWGAFMIILGMLFAFFGFFN